MSEWKEVKISDIAEVVGGGTPSTSISEYWNGDISWLTPKDLTNYKRIYISKGERSISEEGLRKSSAKLMPEGTVLLTSRAPIGYVAIASNPICTNQGFKSFVVNAEIANNLFIYYWIKNNKEYLESIGTGTTFTEISGSVVKDIDILLPPLPEQKAIASVLSSLDDKIDLLHRQNKTLEAMAETLFRQWFVDEAKEDWKLGKLPDEFDFTMGQSPPGNSFNEIGNGTPMFQGNADFGFRFPNERVFTKDPKRFAKPFDTLISVRAPVGAQNMAKKECCIGRGVAAFRYKANPEYYTYTYFKLRSLMNEIKQFNNEGTVFGSISKSDFEALEIMIPDFKTIEKFQLQVKPIDDKVIANCNQIESLTSLRDMLLPKLMSGEVKVE
ncbi:MAG: restriction endonuclease subunit S [Bacteroidales bacterium]|jgi:type I restriction enzyme S subunit|nr:restriction endonuclease subunit S [Bacteroidales bacterium]